MLTGRRVFNCHRDNLDSRGRKRNLLSAMMAVAMDAVSVPIRTGKLPLTVLIHRGGLDRSQLDCRLACDGIDRSAEHDAKQQQ